MLLERFSRIISNDLHLDHKTRVIVGVSGGKDSITLTDLLRRCEIPIVVAHFNHGLRAEAETDEMVVKQYAEKNTLPFVCERAKIADLAEKSKRSIEEQARISRYQFLFRLAKKMHAGFVAVGHTADDQVETILMHLLRGSGLNGLCGMLVVNRESEWGNNAVLIRPLLTIWREEIADYCSQYGLTTCQDESNSDTKYYRNRIRNELVPFLASFNPQVKKRLLETAVVLQGEREVQERGVQAAWHDVVIERTASHILYDLNKFIQMSKGLQRACLRAGARTLEPALRDLDFHAVERIIALIEKRKNRTEVWFSDIRLEIQNGQFLLSRERTTKFEAQYPQIKKKSIVAIPDDSILINPSWRLTVTREEYIHSMDLHQNSKFIATVDFDQLVFPLTIKTSSPGDVFHPLGMDGHSMKISDYWVNRKLPQKYRKCYPIVFDQNGIVWIPGYQISEILKVKPGTKSIMRMELIKV